MPYYVYILQCEDGSYYTGCAKNVNRRFKQHNKGTGARYTQIHRPQKIVYTEKFKTLKEALDRERKIKTLTHQKKQKLTNTT